MRRTGGTGETSSSSSRSPKLGLAKGRFSTMPIAAIGRMRTDIDNRLAEMRGVVIDGIAISNCPVICPSRGSKAALSNFPIAPNLNPVTVFRHTPRTIM